MEGRIILRDCALWTRGGGAVAGRSLLVEGSRLTRVEAVEALVPRPGDWVVECHGRLVTPGVVDLDAGPPAWRSPAGPAQPTPDELEALALHAVAAALRRGVTTLVHHVAPAGGDDPLAERVRGAARRLGARQVVAVELDPGQKVQAPALPPDGALRAAVALDCSRGVEALPLEGAARVAQEAGLPLHVRAPGDAPDLAALARRLARAGSVWSLEGAVPPDVAAALGAVGAVVALPFPTPAGSRGLLHRGGCTRGELTAADWMAAEAAQAEPPSGGWAWVPAAVAAWQTAVFGLPLGELAAGAAADLAVRDLVPRGAVAPFEALAAPVAWTLVHGRVVVREGQLLGAEAPALARDAARAAESLARRSGP